MSKPIIYHIPVCPFSQRVEILLELKGLRDAVEFRVVDITKPRDPHILELSRGTTALPIMDLGGGRVLKESLVILRYVEEAFPEPQVARSDPYERGVERLMIERAGDFTMAGYLMVMNRDRAKAEEKNARRFWVITRGSTIFCAITIPTALSCSTPSGFADLAYTPMFMRFWFLEYYEGFDLPDDPAYDRVRRWRDACMAHPAPQQVSHDEIVKALLRLRRGLRERGRCPRGGRGRPSSSSRTGAIVRCPPRDKYDRIATDAELGLV